MSELGLCSELSEAAGEQLAATATTAERWLLLEVPGTWPRDVGEAWALPPEARVSVFAWLDGASRSRLHFIRRPGRAGRDFLLAFVVGAPEGGGEVRRLELRTHADLAELDLDRAGTPLDSSLVLVCGHGTRDRCCALRGTAVFGALADRLGDEELWFSSHQGGHRFAANVLVLPAGIQLGRVRPEVAPFVVARALAGRIELDHYRGRTCYEPAVQAAELAVRREAGLDGVCDLQVLDVVDGVVRFGARCGTEYAVAVEETVGPPVPASCGAEPEPRRAFVAILR